MTLTGVRKAAARSASVLAPAAGAQRATESLSLIEKVVIVTEIMLTYCRVRWNLNRTELPPLLVRLRAGLGSLDGPANDLAGSLADRLGFIVARTLSFLPTDGPCLVNSLVLTSLLARRGIPSRLVIGVQAEPAFAAHAWVEYGHRSVLPTAEIFERLVEL